MLTAQQYDNICKPNRAVLRFIAEDGGGHNVPIEVYKLSEELGQGRIDLTCNGCKINWIKTLWDLIVEYEKGLNKE